MAISVKSMHVGSGAFSSMLYGVRDARDYDRDRDRLNDYARGLRDHARSFVETTREVLDVMYSDKTRELVEDAMSLLSRSTRNDILDFLEDYRQIATVAPKHRRFLAAHHRYRELVRERRCAAWGEDPASFNIEERKEDDIYYRAVTNGLVREDEETGRYYSEHEFGLQDQVAEQSGFRLTLREQQSLNDTYVTMDNLMDLGIDPSSPTGELL